MTKLEVELNREFSEILERHPDVMSGALCVRTTRIPAGMVQTSILHILLAKTRRIAELEAEIKSLLSPS